MRNSILNDRSASTTTSKLSQASKTVGLLVDCACWIIAAMLAWSLLLPDNAISITVSNVWPHLAAALVILTIARLRRAAPLATIARGVFGLGFLAFVSAPLIAGASAVHNAAEKRITILTFNLRNDNSIDKSTLIDYIASTNADFVFLQEAGALEDHLAPLFGHYRSRSGCEPGTDCSMLVLSNHAFERVERPDNGPRSHRFAVIRTRIANRPITLVGAHLSKPFDTVRHLREMKNVAGQINRLSGDVIVAGDFNATPWSLAIQHLRTKANVRNSYGYRPTWPVWLPFFGLPIDHVFVRGNVETRTARTPDATLGSNHRHLIVELELLPH